MQVDCRNSGTVLIIDDNPMVLDSVKLLLAGHGYTVFGCGTAEAAVNASRELDFDVILSDIRMPVVSGLTLLEEMRTLHPGKPVILMTAYADLHTAVDAIHKGAFDFIMKPFSPEYLIHTINRAVEFASLRERENNYKRELENTVKMRTEELKKALSRIGTMSREIIQRFTRMAEYRDTDTGNHISRIGLYSNKIAEALYMPDDFVHAITFASAMHDIGKIGIPDSILLKPGRLSPEEFAIMKTHTVIGYNMLNGSSHPAVSMAASIALNHHERWDGTGYPNGIKGKEIPLEGMIVMIADQYDALRSKRPYKEPVSHEETCRIITEGDGRTRPEHFSPGVLNAFIEVAHVLDEIFSSKTLTNGSFVSGIPDLKLFVPSV